MMYTLHTNAIDRILDDLSAKRGSLRERALTLIEKILSSNYCFQIADQNFAALMYGCIRSLEGSAQELILAARVLGLLSVTIGCGDKASELYRETVPLLDKVMETVEGQPLISAIHCLAVTTFVSGDFFETDSAMEKLWRFASPNQDRHVLFAAVSAWCLLHTSVDFNLRRSHWRTVRKIHFMRLLGHADESVNSVADDASDLMLETELLKDDIIISIDQYLLSFCSLSQLFQIDYLSDFVGTRFWRHMQVNELLQEVFCIRPEEQIPEDDIACEREEVTSLACIPERVKMDAATMLNIIRKAKTQLLKKKRMLKAQEEKGDLGT